jgi:hypothetical protein
MPSRQRLQVTGGRRALRHAAALVPFAALSTACGPVVDAPSDVSALLTRWWTSFSDGTPDELGVLAAASVDLIDPEALLDGPLQGTQARLAQDDLADVDLHAPPDDDGSWALPDATLARPVFLAKRFPCALDQLERILIDRDQAALYDGEYEAYARTYTSSQADYLARSSDRLDWSVSLTKKVVGFTIDEDLLGGVRRVAVPVHEPAFAADAFLLARTSIPYPASSRNDGVRFDQDYQIEAYLPWGDDEIVHVYGVWRQASALGTTFENDTYANLTLDALARWDDTTTTLCAEGRP